MTRNHTILLVEDNADDVELTRLAFQKSKVENELIVVRDGAEALDYLFASGVHAGRDASSMPAVVLLDLNLPKISGLSVLRRMRADERTRRLPVVVLSTSNEETDILTSYNLGANSYVRKPVDFAQFAESARLLGQYWLTLNEALRRRFRTAGFQPAPDFQSGNSRSAIFPFLVGQVAKTCGGLPNPPTQKMSASLSPPRDTPTTPPCYDGVSPLHANSR